MVPIVQCESLLILPLRTKVTPKFGLNTWTWNSGGRTEMAFGESGISLGWVSAVHKLESRKERCWCSVQMKGQTLFQGMRRERHRTKDINIRNEIPLWIPHLMCTNLRPIRYTKIICNTKKVLPISCIFLNFQNAIQTSAQTPRGQRRQTTCRFFQLFESKIDADPTLGCGILPLKESKKPQRLRAPLRPLLHTELPEEEKG